MENIVQKLKRLQNIAPDAGYTRRSRSLIVEAPITRKPIMSPWQVLVRGLEFGSAIALTAALLLVILGGFSAWKAVSPFQLGSLDPASLRAEAEAVDIQIELTNLAYPEAAPSAASPESTVMTTRTPEAPAAVEATSSPEKVSVDEALDILAE